MRIMVVESHQRNTKQEFSQHTYYSLFTHNDFLDRIMLHHTKNIEWMREHWSDVGCGGDILWHLIVWMLLLWYENSKGKCLTRREGKIHQFAMKFEMKKFVSTVDEYPSSWEKRMLSFIDWSHHQQTHHSYSIQFRLSGVGLIFCCFVENFRF